MIEEAAMDLSYGPILLGPKVPYVGEVKELRNSHLSLVKWHIPFDGFNIAHFSKYVKTPTIQ